MKKIIISTILLLYSFVNAQQEIWVARYNGPANDIDIATAIAVDRDENVYVTGWSMHSGTDADYVTIKYNSDGTLLWSARYYGPTIYEDLAFGIAVDRFGDVYVTGRSTGVNSLSDCLTIKYSSTGNQLWVRRYNGPGNELDGARKKGIAVDRDGNVYITGYSTGTNSEWDFVTIKYNSVGVEQWVVRYNGPANRDDLPEGLAIDSFGNVYVTGSSKNSADIQDYVTIKYNSLGNELWVRRYDGPANYADISYGIAVDRDGNVYVTGYSCVSTTPDFDYDCTTIKYDASGNQLWVKRYDGPADSFDIGYAIAVDRTGNVYVAGWSYGLLGGDDYLIIKYNSDGVEQWVRRYNGQGDSLDWAKAIAVDSNNNVYVTGWSWEGGTGFDCTTIKYSSDGVEQWVARYNGPANGNDAGHAIATDNKCVYVAGGSWGSGTNSDYVIIKYCDPPTGVEKEKTQKSRLDVYPNPCFGSAIISYELPDKTNIRLNIYDLSGRLVRTIYSGTQEKGKYKVELSTGIYFIRLEAKDLIKTKKLTILK